MPARPPAPCPEAAGGRARARKAEGLPGRRPARGAMASRGLLAVLAAATLGAAVLLLAGTATAAEYHVAMAPGNFYNPQSLNVVEGDRITFTNEDPTSMHSATIEGVWDSGFLGRQQSATYRVESVGTFVMRCRNHGDGFTGMRLDLNVANALPTVTIEAPARVSQGPLPSAHGTLAARGTAADVAGGVTAVDVSLDGEAWVPASVTGDRWTASVDIRDRGHGEALQLRARAFDDDGGSGNATSPVTQVRVNRPPAAAFRTEPAAPTSSDDVRFVDASADPDADGGAHGVAGWAWDFGDGATSSQRSPTRRLPMGTHNVTLTVTDDDGAASAVARGQVVVANSPPVAAFAWAPTRPGPGEAATFDSTSTDADGALANLTWDFGDGARGFGARASHAYAAGGNYTVTLTAIDLHGAKATVQRVVEVAQFPGQRPLATLAADATAGPAPLTVRFQVGGSDPDGSVVRWTLDFGDGARASGQGAPPPGHAVTHRYERPGEHDATLTVVDDKGVEGVQRVRVSVAPRPNEAPTVTLEAPPSATVRKGAAARFTAQATDPDGDVPVSWAWDFGDGTRACCALAAVEHAFARLGTFDVALVVADARGGEGRASVRITVEGQPPAVRLTANATRGPAPLAVAFTLAASDGDGEVERWSLDFGDGTPPLRGQGAPPEATFVHTYASPRAFEARVEAADDDGLVATATVALAAHPPPLRLPDGALVAQEVAGSPGTFAMSATTSLAGNLTFRWAFGDGAGAEGRSVRHAYAQPGRYVAALAVLDGSVPVATGELAVEVAAVAGAPLQAAADPASGSVKLTWRPRPGAVAYQVWRSDGGPFVPRAEVDGTSFDDGEVRDAGRYEYRVTARAPDEPRLGAFDEGAPGLASRLVGGAGVVAAVDRDGDGVRDAEDAFPLDAALSAAAPAGPSPLLLLLLVPLAAAPLAYWQRERLRAALGGAPPRLERRYKTVLQLPEGAFGIARVAEDVRGRKVVVKRLLPHWRPDPKVRASFLREGRLAMRVDHPHIVKVFEVDEAEDAIVMEYVEGGSLADKLRQGPLPPREAVRILDEVLQGLARVHGEGIVHRDLKPANILLTRDGSAKVSDFGIAHIPAATMRLSASGAQPGTLLYMAPEQVRNEPPDAATDLYAAAAVLHEMLTGEHYLRGPALNEYDLRRAIVEREVKVAGVPRPLAAVIEKGLAKSRERRYRDAEEMRAALWEAKRQLRETELGRAAGAPPPPEGPR